MTIDWSKPIEHIDGTPLVLCGPDEPGPEMFGGNPDRVGHYWVREVSGTYQCCYTANTQSVRNRAEPVEQPRVMLAADIGWPQDGESDAERQLRRAVCLLKALRHEVSKLNPWEVSRAEREALDFIRQYEREHSK